MKNINLKFLLRPLVGFSRKFYQKYFSEVGYITREINFFINRIILY